MRYKLKFLLPLTALLFACGTSVSPLTVSAETFQAHKPSFGLYCEQDGVIESGTVEYIIDEQGNAVQNSEYRIRAASGNHELSIPFFSAPCELPHIDITVDGKAVTGETRYGEQVFDCENYRIEPDSFYSSELDEGLTGTLYKITAESEHFTVDFEKAENQAFLYSFTENYSVQSGGGRYSYTVNNAQTENVYEIFVLNGEFATIESTAKLAKETLTVKDYLDRIFLENQEYYSLYGNINAEFFYALANRALKDKTNCSYDDFFFKSISQQRINAYRIKIESDSACTVSYSMPVEVQKNNSFKPPIYMVEQTSMGSYPVEVTVTLNAELPYMLESDMQLTKQSDTVFTAQNVSEDYYFIYSSAKKPENLYGTKDNRKLAIILSVVLVAVCISIFLIVYFILSGRKKNKSNR